MATLAELLRQGADKLVNLPSEAQRFITNPQAFTQLLTGKNPLPRETGFAAGATGLPPTEISVLDPNQAPYMQGYSQGEPIGYAGMAAPFAAPAAVATGKALAPKLGQVTENYMVRQGMIQPLTAYHGTPHNIQGQFDINKVGTGEGAQAYGHGMYFAEAPDVAKTYMTVGGKGEFVRIGDKVVPTASQEGQLLSDVTKLGRKAAINKYPDQADYIKTINPDNIQFEGGNLYKVDIPDDYIPNMLLWDEPLSKQPKAVQQALEKLDPNMYSPKGADYDANDLGQLIYERLTNTADKPLRDVWVKKRDELLKKGLTNNPELMAHLDTNPNPAAEASKLLDSLGIKGIKYKDEGSRKTNLSTNTHNFVVFDPAQVKILEQNNKPVTRKELIEKQVKALKE
jgi:hypothetical protein